jgi:hypothetical protein
VAPHIQGYILGAENPARFAGVLRIVHESFLLIPFLGRRPPAKFLQKVLT